MKHSETTGDGKELTESDLVAVVGGTLSAPGGGTQATQKTSSTNPNVSGQNPTTNRFSGDTFDGTDI